MAFGLWTSSDPKNRVLAGRQDPPWQGALLGSGVTSHRQPRQCRGAQGPKTVKGTQSDPNYVSRLLLDCVPVFHKIIICVYLLYRSGPVDKCMCQCGDNVSLTVSMAYTVHWHTFCNAVGCRFELALEVQRWTRARSECLPGEGVKIIVTSLSARKKTFKIHYMDFPDCLLQLLSISVFLLFSFFSVFTLF